MQTTQMGCAVCEEIEEIERGDDEHAVARLSTGYVKVMPNQYLRGSTFFLAKTCVPELHDLDEATRARYLHEMAEVAHAVWRVASPRKLNYELLGNGCPHLHWWLLPRHDDELLPRGPVWEDPNFARLLWTKQGRLPDDERDALRRALLARLQAANVEIEVAYV